MDDTLEQPNPSFANPRDGDHEQDSSGDEDGGLDWTKLPYVLITTHRLKISFICHLASGTTLHVL
jgi:hypothetical protein